MNCASVYGSVARMLLAVIATAVLAIASTFLLNEPWSFFQCLVVYMLADTGIAGWAIGQELNNRLKQLGAYLEQDDDYDDSSI